MRTVLKLMIVVTIGLFSNRLVAQSSPEVFNFQGRLATADGQAVPDGSYDLTIRLYDQMTGGTELWSETQTITTRLGLFTTTLGSSTPFSGVSFAESQYVALSIDGSGEIGSRTPLGSVPYAMTAKRLDEAALEAGSNVTITKKDDGSLKIDAAGGGTGGLTRVTSDATLSGDGTGGSPLTIADKSVTGDKLADSALKAGSNVTINRQGNGSFEIASTGGSSFSLPYSGSVNSGVAAITLQNSGGAAGLLVHNSEIGFWAKDVGWGLAVSAANTDGVVVNSAGQFGVYVVSSNQDGVRIGSTGRYGVHVEESAWSGFAVDRSKGNGLEIGQVATDGVHIASTGQDGVRVMESTWAGFGVGIAKQHGVEIGEANWDGVWIGSTGQSGVRVVESTGSGFRVDRSKKIGVEIGTTTGEGILIRKAGWHGIVILDAASKGIHVQKAGNVGLQIDQSGSNGIQIGTTGIDGIQIQSAGGDGVRVSKAAQDGISVDNAGRKGLYILDAASKGIHVQKAGNVGLQIDESGSNGIQIGTTVFDGVQIQSAGRDGIRVSNAGGWGINATGAAGAAVFNGDVTINGTLSKSGGSFKIDHPLDPENKYLRHSFVESPDMMNVYNGNVTTDERGRATVILPDYFEALNRDFRYQLTAIGAPGPNLYVAQKIERNQFRIAGGEPGMEVSWQVTGIRQDEWANENRIVVEEDKKEE